MIAEVFPDHLLTLEEAPAVTRVFETNEPFPLRIDLTELPDGPARQHGEGNP